MKNLSKIEDQALELLKILGQNDGKDNIKYIMFVLATWYREGYYDAMLFKSNENA